MATPKVQLVYDYTMPRGYCAGLGIAFHDAALPYADRCFAANGLTQKQVDGVVCLYAWNMAHYWKPTTYTRRQRLAIAWMFLRSLRFGRS